MTISVDFGRPGKTRPRFGRHGERKGSRYGDVGAAPGRWQVLGLATR